MCTVWHITCTISMMADDDSDCSENKKEETIYMVGMRTRKRPDWRPHDCTYRIDRGEYFVVLRRIPNFVPQWRNVEEDPSRIPMVRAARWT
jgi:hypothetical protein